MLRSERIGVFRVGARGSAATQEQGIQFLHGELPPGRSTVVALFGTLGGFHLPQQGVHLFQGQAAVGAHRAVAGHRRQQFVARTGGDDLAVVLRVDGVANPADVTT